MGENASSALAQPDYGRVEKVSPYPLRIQRAHDLAAKYPFAAEWLDFYARLAAVQTEAAEALNWFLARCGLEHGEGRQYADRAAGTVDVRGGNPEPQSGERAVSLHTPEAWSYEVLRSPELPDAHCDFLLSLAPGLDNLVRAHGPAALVAALESVEWAQVLARFWLERDAALPGDRFLAMAILQPYAELLAQNATTRGLPTPGCPVCGSKPVAGVLRPEGFGARRSLLCSLCATEWEYVRARCPSCEESRPDAIGVYTSEQFAHVRLECCDSCGHYLKTIDLTKDGTAVALVDELATTPLDLWAAEKNYTKICHNLFGL